MNTAEPLLLVTRDARGVVTLTLNRPLAFNALNEELLAALQTAIDAIDADDQGRRLAVPGHEHVGALRRADRLTEASLRFAERHCSW